ncbi:hypothetical protein [Verrucomicrobium spinosum]|uniref:hypothetical protein n=1 Tax=Verrucomicrobium spinosum TaxID=2736 RepID=UPI00017469A5|nr:hypothetical protein [Verrucomicrobium spinosum]
MAHAQIERTWLTHQTHTPDAVVVSWQTATPAESVVRYRAGDGAAEEEAHLPGIRTLHHVAIPVKKPATASRQRRDTTIAQGKTAKRSPPWVSTVKQ